MPEKAIVDTSTLIALDKIGLSEILCKIYTEIILPEAVISEFGTPTIDCYSTKNVKSQLVSLFVSELNLGRGEAEVLALARETGIRIIMDDEKARKVAKTLGLNITGTIGVLLKAEKIGLINSAYTKVKELREKGFYVSDELLEKIASL
jgi:predicted nucleic acid-binding protein